MRSHQFPQFQSFQLISFKSQLKKSSVVFGHVLFFAALYILVLTLSGCGGSKRFTSDESYRKYYEKEFKTEINTIRVLLDENPSKIILSLQSSVYLFRENRKIIKVNGGSSLECYIENDELNIRYGRQNFTGKYFQLIPLNGEGVIRFNGKSFKGSVKIVLENAAIKIINFVDLENYLKGVIAEEMPLGENDENYEALKAFAIVARTYAFNKMDEGKLLYDIFPDTRDQVYGGKDAEYSLSSKAVDETRGMILTYDGEPAVVYYHSTCGGKTAAVENVFPVKPLPYLQSIRDGDGPYCKISPRFKWEETFTESSFIKKLYNAKLIDSEDYEVNEVFVESRFPSGRVNELKIILDNRSGGRKEIILYGNDIRTKIRTAEKDLALWSTLFDVYMNSYEQVIINGKGYGHGVGLCQWGAIGQSREGIGYEKILELYFHGTEIGRIND